MAEPAIFLFLSILSSTGIFLIFRLIEKRGAETFPVIVINYIMASGLGLCLSIGHPRQAATLPAPFYGLAVLIGILFIVMFFIVGRSSQKAGMSITTVAGKMSVVFPIAFSLVLDPDDVLSGIKLTGIILALPGVLMTVIKKRQNLPDPSFFFLPLILFIGMGIVDSMVKLAQFRYVSESNLSQFTALLFSISAIIGIVVTVSRKGGLSGLLRSRVIFRGGCLGVANFGSIYFLVRALDFRDVRGPVIDGSVVFGINNIGIVALSVFLGMLLFREKLSMVNMAGIVLCIISMLFLANAS